MISGGEDEGMWVTGWCYVPYIRCRVSYPDDGDGYRRRFLTWYGLNVGARGDREGLRVPKRMRRGWDADGRCVRIWDWSTG